MNGSTGIDCFKCKFDNNVFYGKKSMNAHFLEKHPDVVQKIIEHSYFEKKTPEQQVAWAAGFARFINSKSCEDGAYAKEK